MAVRLLAGYFGSPDPWAVNGFEDMEPGDSGFVASIYGHTHNGDVFLEIGFFGPET